jgi:tRNA (guanine6-N2)-methyltransferase
VTRQPEPAAVLCEADVAEGLEVVAEEEIRARLGRAARIERLADRERPSPEPRALRAPWGEGAGSMFSARQLRGIVRFSYSGELRELLKLKTVQAVFLAQQFAVPRPKALLGDEHLRKLLGMIEAARGLFPAGTFKTLHLNAAGSDSSVMVRLKSELARRAGLAVSEDEGDLLMRIRPSYPHPSPPPRERSSSGRGESAGEGDGGWEVLVRLSPRPLATRAWRVCNFEGALNGAVAHAMVALTKPGPRDVFLNIACGSGTLLMERLAHGPARQAIGCDIDPRALACARENVIAGGHAGHVKLCLADARGLPLREGSVDALAADLPFGHLVGSHAENVANYPLILREAARVARPGARLALITHEVRLVEGELARMPAWALLDELRVELGGLHPRIFLLQRT